MDSIEVKSSKLPSGAIGERSGLHIESQLTSRGDIGKAHQFFSGGAEAHAAAAVPSIPGSESAALAALPGAKDPISPLVQMIMRMPGHIGLLNSFFEALQSFFVPHSDLLSGFDPSVLGAHAAETTSNGFSSSLEHGTIDPAILPPESHIFDGLDTGLSTDLSLKTAWQMNLHSTSSEQFNNSLNVSGQNDVGTAIYEHSSSDPSGVEKGSINEQGGGVLAGPSISQMATGSHLAGSHPIFSNELFDRAGSQNHNAMLAAAPQNAVHTSAPQATGNMPQQLVQHYNQAHSNALYANGNPMAQHTNAIPAAADMINSGTGSGATNAAFSFVPRSDLNLNNAGFVSQQNFGPSGAVSDNLGAKNILDSNDQLASNFHPPTISSSGASDLSSQQVVGNQLKETQSAVNGNHLPLKGLKAQELALNGSKLPKLSNSHHATTAHSTSSPKTSTLSSHAANKSAVNDGNTATLIKPHATSHAHHDVKAAPVAGEQDKIAMNERVALPTSTDQINLEANSHTVHSGDSLWKVAEDRLGDPTRWPDIYKLNMDKIGADPNLIHPGLKLDLPEHAQDIATPTQSTSDYVVKNGDNLWDISERLYGNGTHWGDIYHLNSNVIGSNPGLIFPGEKLSISSADASPAVATTTGGVPVHPSAAAAPVSVDTGHLAATARTSVESAANHLAPKAAMSNAQQVHAPLVEKSLAFSGTCGAAGAATLNTTTTTADAAVVSPSLAPDLSYFARKR